MTPKLSKQALRTHASQGWKFVIVGGLSAGIDLGTLHFLVTLFDVSSYVAQICSTLLAVCVVFLLNKLFTFKSHSKNVRREAIRFAFVYGVAIVSNLCMTAILLWLGVYYLLAKVIAIGVGVLWNYGMSHAYVFRDRGEEPLPVEVF